MLRVAVVTVLATAGCWVVTATAGADYTWEGIWSSTFGNIDMKADGSGTYPGGTISGGVQGPDGRSNSGTWQESSSSGKYLFTMNTGGRAFAGTYSRDPGDGCVFPPCNWDGQCLSGACVLNGPSAPATKPPEPTPPTPRSVRPEVGKVTSYPAPEPGKTGKLPLPALGPETKAVELNVGTAGANGSIHPAPPVAGIQGTLTNAERTALREDGHKVEALKLCYIFILAAPEAGKDFTLAVKGCAAIIYKILKRYDEIQAKKRDTGGRAAQAGSCKSVKPRRGAKPLRTALRVKCKPTAAGLRLTFRRRKGGPALHKLFGRKARLVVGRSRFDVPAAAGDRTNVLWTASSG
jgi:hypothetical protein